MKHLTTSRYFPLSFLYIHLLRTPKFFTFAGSMHSRFSHSEKTCRENYSNGRDDASETFF